MSFSNRTYDNTVSRLVVWTTPAADPTGASYPGPGVFGVDTTGYTVEFIPEPGGGGGSAATFLWREGGPVAPDVYTSWAALYAAVNAAPPGSRVVYVDDAYAAPTIPAGTWDLYTWEFRGMRNPWSTYMVVAEGAVITFANPVGAVLWFYDMYVEFQQTATPAYQPANWNSSFRLVRSELGMTGTLSPISLSSGFNFLMSLTLSGIAGSVGIPFVDTTGGGGFGLMMEEGSYLYSNQSSNPAFGGNGTVAVTLASLSADYAAHDPAIYTGTPYVQNYAQFVEVPNIIWKQGALPSVNNVYGTWEELYTAVSALPEGQRRVCVDNTSTTFPAIPAGTWNLSSWHFVGATAWVPYLQIDEGAVISLAYNKGITFENLYINVLSTSVAPITKAADGGVTTITFRGRPGTSGCWVDVGTTGATQPFITTSGIGGGTLRIINDGVRFVGNGSTPAINIANTGLTTEIVMAGRADLYDGNAVASAVGTTVTFLLQDPSANYIAQTNMLGTVITTPQSVASSVAYDDAVSPALGATTVQGALDAVKPLLGGSGFGSTMPSYGTLTSFDEEFLLTSTTSPYEGLLHAVTSGTAAAVNLLSGALDGSGLSLFCYTGTDTTGFAGVCTSPTNGYGNVMFGTGIKRFRQRISINALSDGTDTFHIYSGMFNTGTLSSPATSNTGAFFYYSHGFNSGRIMCFYNGSANGSADSGVAMAVFTEYTLEAEINAAGTQAKFWINGALVATINIAGPTTNPVKIVPAAIKKQLGTTGRGVTLYGPIAWNNRFTTPF